jgi:protein-disulfide isomerase
MRAVEERIMSEPRTVEPVHLGDHVRGAEHPALTLIQYGDFECPHTRASQEAIHRLLDEYDDLLFVFRHFPLRDVHVRAEALSRVAESADRQGKYWSMHDRLMRHHRSVDPGMLADDGRAVGLDLGAVARDLRDPVIAARVQHDVEEGVASGVHATPTFFVEGRMHEGHYDYDTLSRRIAEARQAH